MKARLVALASLVPMLGVLLALAACDSDNARQSRSAAPGRADSRTPAVGVYSRERVQIPGTWRRFGIVSGQAFRFDNRDHDELPFGVLPAGDQVIMSISPKGDRDPFSEALWLARFDLRSGTLTRRMPVTAGALAGKTLFGDRVAWLERQRVTDPACPDIEYGCFRWTLLSSDVTLDAPTTITRQPDPVPRRAVPEFFNRSREGVCWTASDDGRHWSAYGWTPGGTPRRLMTAPAWLRECQLVGRDAVVRRWGLSAAGVGDETILRVRPDGTTSTFARHTNQAVPRGGRVALLTDVDPVKAIRKVQVRPLDESAPARTVWEPGTDVYELGWLDDDVLWVQVVTGLYLVRLSTGETEMIARPMPSARPAAGNGQLVYGEIVGSDTWSWRLVVLRVPGA